MNPRSFAPAHIETARLRLREFTAQDEAALSALFSCPAVMRFSPSGPLSAAQSRARLDEFLASYAAHGFGKWAVELRASGEVIGCCGPALAAIDGPPERELGYRLRAEHWGRGLASEAAAAALAHCFGPLRFEQLVGFVEPANTASVHVLGKLGMRYQRRALWLGHAVDIYVAHAPTNA